jgi:hypothetical protein
MIVTAGYLVQILFGRAFIKTTLLEEAPRALA